MARLAPDLSSFVYSSHLGGTDVDTGFGLAVDVNGGVHVGGDTLSADFPMKNAVRTTFSGAREAFVSNICDPILIASTTNLFFQYEVGKAVPAAQTVQISACAPIAFQVQAVGDFIRATPVNGVTNGTISVAVDPKNLQPGTYQGQVRITATDAVNSPLSFSVVFKVTGPPPVISAAGVAHGAAAQAGAVAPGELIVIYGQNMGPQGLGGAELDGLGRVSTTIQDTRVYFDGVAAPMVYTSSGQISTIVPYAVAGHAVTNIEVEFQGVRSNKISVPVTATAPRHFHAESNRHWARGDSQCRLFAERTEQSCCTRRHRRDLCHGRRTDRSRGYRRNGRGKSVAETTGAGEGYRRRRRGPTTLCRRCARTRRGRPAGEHCDPAGRRPRSRGSPVENRRCNIPSGRNCRREVTSHPPARAGIILS
ncbi:MAG: IPT/TIG domain-containing protein [Acidobacteriota bacterium]